MNITTDELLEAIQQAMGPMGVEDALTVHEIVAATGWGRTKITTTLHALAKDGRLEVVRVRRKALDQRWSSIPAYRIKA